MKNPINRRSVLKPQIEIELEKTVAHLAHILYNIELEAKRIIEKETKWAAGMTNDFSFRYGHPEAKALIAELNLISSTLEEIEREVSWLKI